MPPPGPTAFESRVALFEDPAIQKHFSAADLEVVRNPQVVAIYVDGGDGDKVLDDDTAFPDMEDPTRVGILAIGDQEQLALAVSSSIAGSDGSAARCFNPHHGVRFQRGDRTVDLLICLGCRRFMISGAGLDDLPDDVRFGTLDGSLRPAIASLCTKYGLKDTGGC